MADITPTLIPSTDKRYARYKWETFTPSDTNGIAVGMGAYPDRSVQVFGNFGTAGEITIQGSLDGGTTWATLTDPQGNALVFTSAKIEAITELVPLIRPIRSAGTGAVDLDVYMSFAGGD